MKLLWLPETHWERPWCWERLRGKGKGGSRGWDGYIASQEVRWGRTSRLAGKPLPLPPSRIRATRRLHETAEFKGTVTQVWSRVRATTTATQPPGSQWTAQGYGCKQTQHLQACACQQQLESQERCSLPSSKHHLHALAGACFLSEP